MSIWDWLGPLNIGGKARGWDALPIVQPEQKQHSWTQVLP